MKSLGTNPFLETDWSAAVVVALAVCEERIATAETVAFSGPAGCRKSSRRSSACGVWTLHPTGTRSWPLCEKVPNKHAYCNILTDRASPSGRRNAAHKSYPQSIHRRPPIWSQARAREALREPKSGVTLHMSKGPDARRPETGDEPIRRRNGPSRGTGRRGGGAVLKVRWQRLAAREGDPRWVERPPDPRHRAEGSSRRRPIGVTRRSAEARWRRSPGPGRDWVKRRPSGKTDAPSFARPGDAARRRRPVRGACGYRAPSRGRPANPPRASGSRGCRWPA